jgi:hypothetical protein
VDSFETKPIRRLKLIHNRLTREFTTAVVRCTLQKRAGNKITVGQSTRSEGKPQLQEGSDELPSLSQIHVGVIRQPRV